MTSVEPESGTLVVFRSEAVPHEVLETKRARQAVVGWIHGSIDSYYNGAFDKGARLVYMAAQDGKPDVVASLLESG